ncbi:MAG: hypothetical protein AB7K41_11235, partial [Bdellovibrionales bacterium]
GAPVHEFSLKNQVWTIHNFIKGPTPGRNNYVMEKFSYSEKSDLFTAVTAMDNNIFVLKLP